MTIATIQNMDVVIGHRSNCTMLNRFINGGSLVEYFTNGELFFYGLIWIYQIRVHETDAQ